MNFCIRIFVDTDYDCLFEHPLHFDTFHFRSLSVEERRKMVNTLKAFVFQTHPDGRKPWVPVEMQKLIESAVDYLSKDPFWYSLAVREEVFYKKIFQNGTQSISIERIDFPSEEDYVS